MICAGALYSLIVLGMPAGESAIVKSLSSMGPPRFSAWLAESLRWVLLTGNLGALLFGLVFIVRPSALKSLEAWADRRISARKSTKPLEEAHLTAGPVRARASALHRRAGDPGQRVRAGESRLRAAALGPARGIKHPRIWTAKRDREMWQAIA